MTWGNNPPFVTGASIGWETKKMLEKGQRVQVLVSQYHPDGELKTLTAPGPIGTVHGVYDEYVIVDLGENGFYSDLSDDSKSIYTKLAVVHPDNLMTVPEG
jgi:hypothetical protein